MENIPNFENREREAEIDKLIGELAEKEEMNPEDVLSDIITFAPVEGNEDPNLEYLDMVAECAGLLAALHRDDRGERPEDHWQGRIVERRFDLGRGSRSDLYTDRVGRAKKMAHLSDLG